MAIYRDGELWLYGYVGESYWDEGFTASEVLAALAEHGRDQDITVHINSGGGSVYDGLAIYNALTAHKGDVRIEVDAIAASAASTIAMSGDRIVMRAGSLMMIHDPSGITFGTADDHEKQRDALNKIADQMASIYAERSGLSATDVRETMREELWLTSDEAVEQGYADEAEQAKAKTASAFDYRVYAHAPSRLTALAKRKNWSFETDHPAASAAPTGRTEESSMTDKERADQLAAELAALKTTAKADADARAKLEAEKADRDRQDAIMALPEAKGREATAKALADTPGITAEAAKSVLVTAKVESDETGDEDEVSPSERIFNGAGLGRGKPQAKTMRFDIVADMKRRHGIQ